MGPVLSFLGAVFFGVSATASAGYILAVNLARLGLLSLASKFLAPKIDLQQTAADKLLTVKSTVQPQAFVYGEDMLSGPLMFAQVSGDNNEHLHRLVALTGREIDSYQAFRIDDTDIDISDDIPDANDTVSAGDFADVVQIQTQLGTSTQTVLSQLNTDFASLWTSAHRGRGWSQLYTKMSIVGGNTAFEKGVPQNLRALVKGHKVYDPRLDSTQIIDSSTSPVTKGSGSHLVGTPSTWAWSDNPALCLADWLIWDEVGMGEETDRIDYEMVAQAADICEQQVLIPPAASPSNYQNRYTCNFTFYGDQQRGQVKSILESAMLGRCVFSQGKWRMWAGAALTSTVTLTEENLAGGIQVEASTGTKERYNTVRGKFVDPARDYHANPYPQITDASYVTDDGSTKYKTVDFNACNNNYEAQRNAIHVNRQSRNQIVVRFEGNWSCFQIQCGHVVELNIAELGWSATSSPISTKKFLVTEWELDREGKGVRLTLVEENDSVWDDPAIGDYTTRTATGELVSPGVPAVALSDASIMNEGTEPVYAGVRLGADGRLRYGNASNSYYDNLVPPNEWLGSGTATYYSLATVTDGTLQSGTEDTWQEISTDQTWYVQKDSTSSPVATNNYAVVDLAIASDITVSPITVLTSGTFTLGANKVLPIQGVIIQDSSATQTNPGVVACQFTFKPTGTSSPLPATSNKLYNVPLGETSEEAFDGVQWLDDGYDSDDYLIRANGVTDYDFTGAGSMKMTGGDAGGTDNLITTYLSTPTPWKNPGTNSVTLSCEAAYGAGEISGTVLIEIGTNTSPVVIITSAYYTISSTHSGA